VIRRIKATRTALGTLDWIAQSSVNSAAIAAGRFHANALRVAKRPHPGQHLPIALAGRGETMSSQNAILFVHDHRDMQIFMRIHAADGATL
jgi:hypothetical protein